MPMIDVYAVAGTFGNKPDLTKALNQALMRWEKVPEIPLFLDNTAAFIHDLEPDALANAQGDSNYVRVQILTPVGVLDREKQLGVVKEMTEIVELSTMRGCIDQRVDSGAMTTDCAEQVADAARTAALAERRHLARDLHDSVTQTLISLYLTAQAAAELWDTQPAQARAALDTIRHLATGATIEMRALLIDLHDAVLAQQGLVAALEAYSTVVRQRSGLHVQLRLGAAGARAGPPGPAERLPRPHEEALYYIVREALANVVKHARARRAGVTLAARAGWVGVRVEDDGVGFPPEAREGSPGDAFGLRSMRERVQALGGTLRMGNGSTGGAYVRAELPVARAREAALTSAVPGA
jgi:signal transduction histidine kinase